MQGILLCCKKNQVWICYEVHEMVWIKQGKIFVNEKNSYWNQTHAQSPIIDSSDDKIWRIYYNTRDLQCRTRPSYIDVEAGNPKNILYVHNEPILDLGSLGSFDDCGAMCSDIINRSDGKYLYYLGWNVRNTISYHLSIGVAHSLDGKKFKKCFEGPIMDRINIEPYLCTSCSIIVENDCWKMWYTSGTGHKVINGHDEPYYNIKYATSKNGLNWDRKNIVSIKYKNEYEALGVPSVLFEDNKYKMWYSYRNVCDYRTNKDVSYRIGYAESSDGIYFIRMDDKVGIDVSPQKDEWDSEMVAYGRVIKFKEKKYMFYNGNGFGKTGFGYAVWED